MQGGRDYGMDSALEQTKIILEDLTVLNVSSWQLWIAVSNVDYCDGLIYENDGPRTFETTKRYYAFGHFTKFIEPGSKRCGVSAPEGVTAAAFTKDGRQTAVLMNPGDTKTLKLPEEATAVYLTDETHDLAEIKTQGTLALPPKSVVTLLFSAEGRDADD
jgi:O-glycosyl hydrolase